MALIIPRKLRALVENYILKSNRNKEMGGYFFGDGENITAFLPIPNHSKNPQREYSLGNTKPIAEVFARMLDSEIIADMHTHPDGSVPSEGDKGYVRGMAWKYHIIISDKKDELEWWSIDKNLRSVPVVYSDVELSAYGELIAREIGLKTLGRVFLSPNGELLGSDEAKMILDVDEDVMTLLDWEKSENWRNAYYVDSERTMAHAQRDTGISLSRIKKAFIKLGWK